jgi:hypothetical protein
VSCNFSITPRKYLKKKHLFIKKVEIHNILNHLYILQLTLHLTIKMSFFFVDGNAVPASCILDPLSHALGLTGGMGQPHIGLGAKIYLSDPRRPFTDYMRGGIPPSMVIRGAIKGSGYIGSTGGSYDGSYDGSLHTSTCRPDYRHDPRYISTESSSLTYNSAPEIKKTIETVETVETVVEKKSLYRHDLVETINVAIVKNIAGVRYVVLFAASKGGSYFFPHASVISTMSALELANHAIKNWTNGIVSHEYIGDDTCSFVTPIERKKTQQTFIKNIDNFPVEFVREMASTTSTKKNVIFSFVSDVIVVPVNSELLKGRAIHPITKLGISLSPNTINSVIAVFSSK